MDFFQLRTFNIYLYSQQVQLIDKKVKTHKSAKKIQQFTTMIINSISKRS